MDTDVLRAWLAVVDEDIRAAKGCMQPEFSALKSASYHCQQAAEKLVKALLAAQARHPPKTHRIGELCDLLGPDHPLIGLVRPFERFTVYNTAFRYPGFGFIEAEIIEPTGEDIADWLEEIEQARDAALRLWEAHTQPSTKD